MIAMERAIKGTLFNCSMYGNCLLQETAYTWTISLATITGITAV